MADLLLERRPSLVEPVVAFEPIGRDQLNHCLVAWGHRMGPWERPDFGRESFCGMFHDGRLVGVTASAPLITPRVAGLSRDQAFELGRVCAAREHLCRPLLRLWREFVFPSLCRAHGWTWAISYQDAALHTGNLYRFDGWVPLGRSSSGSDPRGCKKGRRKVIWGWHADPAVRARPIAPTDGGGRGTE